MIKNYFKIAFRGFWKHKLFTLINIVGLSIGISAALVIYLIVNFDFTFDKFHKDSDRIYRVSSTFSFQGEKGFNGGVCGPLAGAVKSQVAGVEFTAPFFCMSSPNVFIPGKKGVPVRFKDQDNVVLADGAYFKIFNYKWLAGNPATALIAPNQCVLTSEQAQKYFAGLPYSQVIGKVVNYDTIKTTVTGVVQTLSANSDLTFHDFISYSTGTLTANKSLSDQLQLNEWESTNSASQLFIKLSATASPARIGKQLNDILKKASPPRPDSKGTTHNFVLQPLSELHFNEQLGIFDFTARVANKKTLYFLLGIAAFLLILGCINFINLTTAQATQRAKEIGIRKTMGSNRRQLIFQFLSETFLITLFAVIISIVATPLILKLFTGFIPKGLKADLLQTNILLFLILLTAVVSLASGFYPAIMLSGYKPALVLKNQTSTNSSKTRNAWLRKSLTVTQFIIAQFFIMATILVSKQIYFALHKDLGFKKEAIIVVNSPWKNRTAGKNQVFLNALRSIPQVEMVSTGGAPPSSGNTNSTLVTYKDGKKEIKTEVQLKFGDPDYLKIYKLKLLAGRGLQAGDSSKSVIINANYAKVLGFRNPGQAIGKTLDHFNGVKSLQIVGVVADFHQKSLHEPIKPLAYYYGTNRWQTGTFHIALKPESPGGNEWKAAIATMGKSWKQIYPDDDFEYNFFDESIAKFYEEEQHTSKLLTWATGLSIFISCLGLLGLAIYTTNQRTKEIGVRKVLGASVFQIVRLLSTELVLLILLAFVIVTPVAWLAMNKWMESFAERTSISWWIFAASGIGMLMAAVITSSFQTVKAGIANPVKSLRSE
ncbi:ABC transporter permease [Mucilaginibacter gotjawali]|uniref:ABC-type antimicrobial peptide transport system permease subunit n=2 Tax=Mucilaginibacter gotjawali TaxID=1550579 RepID=A0A839S9T8_9SPHI|nr:ABC transporter permease [Mucilaginibacter gotjawali]MBB3054122.1 ABC-type antimicrobial peptide transport system permease subunit [Mucilaginibacter gotjawali]BAU54390.1 putative ABC transporter permease YknZ [Mucilaginibacter gotjawali]